MPEEIKRPRRLEKPLRLDRKAWVRHFHERRFGNSCLERIYAKPPPQCHELPPSLDDFSLVERKAESLAKRFRAASPANFVINREGYANPWFRVMFEGSGEAISSARPL